MKFYFLIPALLGLCSALQGICNRKLMTEIGLASAVVINALIVAALAVAWFLIQRPANIAETFSGFQWWWIVAGLCGFTIIALTPVSIANLGAATTFALFVVFQVLAGVGWDLFTKGALPQGLQLVSLLLAVGGATGLILTAR
jgi:uncharacterized membrane protein YdcZ (DUF606 family)